MYTLLYSICAEFANIKERALKRPENTEELMAMVSFVEMARSSGMVKLNERIRDCHERLNYLLDVHLFAAGDIELNARVLTWPSAINPVFDENDELVEKCKASGEKGMLERKEKLIAEIEKVRKRADEFNDMGEMDRMAEYGNEVRKLQKRIETLDEQIAWVNKVCMCTSTQQSTSTVQIQYASAVVHFHLTGIVSYRFESSRAQEETMYKVPLSTFPEVEQIKTEVEPFLKLFQTVLKFQKADKKWLYGNFRELNAEAIEAELDEYTRDVYKVQKYFNNKGAPPPVLLCYCYSCSSLKLRARTRVHTYACSQEAAHGDRGEGARAQATAPRLERAARERRRGRAAG